VPLKADADVTAKPAAKRQGYAYAADIKSFFLKRTSSELARIYFPLIKLRFVNVDLCIKYQIKAKEGITRTSNFVISAIDEKSPDAEITEDPEKKMRI